MKKIKVMITLCCILFSTSVFGDLLITNPTSSDVGKPCRSGTSDFRVVSCNRENIGATDTWRFSTTTCNSNMNSNCMYSGGSQKWAYFCLDVGARTWTDGTDNACKEHCGFSDDDYFTYSDQGGGKVYYTKYKLNSSNNNMYCYIGYSSGGTGCKNGYWGYSTCTKCGSLTAANGTVVDFKSYDDPTKNTSQTACYIPKGGAFQDASGTYNLLEDCYYTN